MNYRLNHRLETLYQYLKIQGCEDESIFALFRSLVSELTNEQHGIALSELKRFVYATKNLEDTIHCSKTPFLYLGAFNGPTSLLHTVEVLHDLGVSLRRVRILPDIGRVTEPETRLYQLKDNLGGLLSAGSEQASIRVAVNVREDNRLHRFLPLLAVGLPSQQAIQAWDQGRAAQHVPADEDTRPLPFTPLQGFHSFYLEPGAMPADWTNRITPAERLAIQLCQRYSHLCDPGTPVQRIAGQMLIVAGSGFEERDNPLAGLVLHPEVSLISHIGTVLELVEVFLTQAMLTIAGGDLLGGFQFILPFEPPEVRQIPLLPGIPSLTVEADPEALARWYNVVARWFNAYPHRIVTGIEELNDLSQSLAEPSCPKKWSANDPDIQKAARRIVTWYRSGSVETAPWDPDGTKLKYKLPDEGITPDEMLSLGRTYLPDFLPDYPRQVFTLGGMNVEGLLLGLTQHWLKQGAFLGMNYSDWALFPLADQAVLCGLLVQRSRCTDQCALFEASVRLLIDEGIQTWIETFRKEKTALGSPLAQLGHSLALGGIAALHAPTIMVRIPRDYTRDPEAKALERKLHVLEALFLPAHIPAQHIWKIDWVKLGETAYLKREINPVNPDLIPEGVRLYDGSN